ncbi:IS3 family transposase [Mucilaginibacter conchicola]|uniref:IS3 family transposase n=1 Tax=Mucilaginibacter conchicola TaxID=2303333 RepID=A0A372NXM9_9SPHI|nr:IS3 family transposase [Mucilaginibacter conchicola]RFZ94865.1 IS3 family transposase [Mucilaginibacter conchicola]
MKARYPKINMDTLCGLFGYSRQAFYQLQQYEYKYQAQSQIILEMVSNERQSLPGIGGRKLLSLMSGLMKREGIQLGRDAFFALLRENRLLVRHLRSKIKTTDSRHRFRRYPNLIRELVPSRPHELWVSDITYVETGEGYLYLSLVTDAYSRKIVGWNLSPKLEADGAVNALDMAILQLPDPHPSDLIHHSDRGIQHCCDKYISRLRSKDIHISMTENGDPLENAIAERVNDILKSEWLNKRMPQTKWEAQAVLPEIIHAYNHKRPHMSIGMRTPATAHTLKGELSRAWKSYYQKDKTEPMNAKDELLVKLKQDE